MLLGEFGFHAAIAFAIAREDDFSFDAYAEQSQLAVIIGSSVVRIDDVSGDFARGRIRVESADGALVVGIGVAIVGRFGRRERSGLGLHEFEFDVARLGSQAL